MFDEIFWSRVLFSIDVICNGFSYEDPGKRSAKTKHMWHFGGFGAGGIFTSQHFDTDLLGTPDVIIEPPEHSSTVQFFSCLSSCEISLETLPIATGSAQINF
jgi:hypothetical protein